MSREAPRSESVADLQRRVTELGTLYEISRALIGATDAAQIASRVVLSGIGALGARSGALYAADDAGRYRLLFASSDGAAPPESLALPRQAREWMLREGSFTLRTSAAGRALGPLHDSLQDSCDAAIGAAVADANGLLAMMVFGPRVLDDGYDDSDRSLLDALAALTGQALAAFAALRAKPSARAGRPTARSTRSMNALRSQYPALESMIGVGSPGTELEFAL